MSKMLCIDFDGVLHSYRSGWQGADVIPDPPVPGAIEWLRTLIASELVPMVYSARSSQDGGIAAMQEWLVQHGLTRVEVDHALQWPVKKPPAFLTIDDRAIQFDGNFGPLNPERLLSFTAWWERPVPGLAEMPADRDLYTLVEFGELVDAGGFVDHDGRGYWATEDGYMPNSSVRPSTFKDSAIPHWVTHIYWCNR